MNAMLGGKLSMLSSITCPYLFFCSSPSSHSCFSFYHLCLYHKLFVHLSRLHFLPFSWFIFHPILSTSLLFNFIFYLFIIFCLSFSLPLYRIFLVFLDPQQVLSLWNSSFLLKSLSYLKILLLLCFPVLSFLSTIMQNHHIIILFLSSCLFSSYLLFLFLLYLFLCSSFFYPLPFPPSTSR